ncbi:MAG: hypothetical protein MUE44_16265 [Oscillatoriaceae cyanobacterium Prado104]|jgi:hypothetical protein|nr:hypothetical protein [Oscillatoriaceae cyanobacterium Prado104]
MNTDNNNSHIVEENGIIFETLMPEVVVKIPDTNKGVSPVQFGIRVTNVSDRSYHFMLPYVLPELFYSDGQAMYRSYASNVYLPAKQSYFQLARPQKSLTFFMQGEFKWYKNLLILRGKATDGGIWRFSDFKNGIYLVQFTYRNDNAKKEIRWKSGKFSAWHDLWVGQVSTPRIEFCLHSLSNKEDKHHEFRRTK